MDHLWYFVLETAGGALVGGLIGGFAALRSASRQEAAAIARREIAHFRVRF